jgi:hypothetical protein
VFTHGDASDYYTYKYYYLWAKHYPRLVENDSCVVNIFTNEEWFAYDEYLSEDDDDFA